MKPILIHKWYDQDFCKIFPSILYVIDPCRCESFLLSILNQRNTTTNFFCFHTKTAAMCPRKHLCSIVRSCDVYVRRVHVTFVMQASVLSALPRPSLLGARPASGICDIFPSLYISMANLTNFSHARHSRLCGPSALQSDRQNKLSLNQWIYEWCETGSFHMASHEMTRFCPQACERVKMVKLSGIQEGLTICLTI